MRRTFMLLMLFPLMLAIVLSGCDSPSGVTAMPALTEQVTAAPALTFTEEVFLELTDAKYGGREYDSEGNTAAGEYIAGLYASLGLEPFYEGTYYYGFEYEGGTENNIVAYQPGTVGQSAVVLCAHFDGFNKEGGEGFVGAYDNASGVAAMLSVAKLLTGTSFKNDIVYLATNVEEHHLIGAKAIANYLSGRYEAISLFNIDCIGYAAYEDALVSYGRDKPNALSAAAAQALGAAQHDSGYPGDSIAFTQQNIAVCALSDTRVTMDNAPAEPVHGPADARENVDCAKVERFAIGLAAFIEENGDRAFAPDAEGSDIGQEVIDAHSEIDALLATIPAQHGLAYHEAYCCRLASDGSLVLIMGIGKVDTPEKVKYLFPDVEIPERTGAYALSDVSINGDCYYSSCRGVWERNGMQTLMDTLENFAAGTFKEGELYPFELPAPGSQLSAVTMQYSNGAETLIFQIRLNEAPDQYTAEYLEDAGAAIGDEFAGYLVGGSQGSGADDGYCAAIYAGETGSYIYLLTVMPKDDGLHNVYRSAEEFANLLRALDMPALLAMIQGVKG